MRRQVIFCGDPKKDQPKEKEDDRQEAWQTNLSTAYQEVPVSIDAVSQTSDEESEVGGGENEGGYRHKHHPPLQQGHRHIGRRHQDPY